MTAPVGTFDAGIVAAGWFDAAVAGLGVFDYTLIAPAAGGSPPTPSNISNKLQVDGFATDKTFNSTEIGFSISAGKDYIFVCAHYVSGGADLNGVTIGGSAASLGEKVSQGESNVASWYVRNCAGSDTDVVVDFGAGSDNYLTGVLIEFPSGTLVASPVNASGNNQATASVGLAASTSAPTTTNNVITIGAIGCNNSGSDMGYTGPSESGFTLAVSEVNSSAHQSIRANYKIGESSTGTKTVTYSSNAARDYHAIIICYEYNLSGGGPTTLSADLSAAGIAAGGYNAGWIHATVNASTNLGMFTGFGSAIRTGTLAATSAGALTGVSATLIPSSLSSAGAGTFAGNSVSVIPSVLAAPAAVSTAIVSATVGASVFSSPSSSSVGFSGAALSGSALSSPAATTVTIAAAAISNWGLTDGAVSVVTWDWENAAGSGVIVSADMAASGASSPAFVGQTVTRVSTDLNAVSAASDSLAASAIRTSVANAPGTCSVNMSGSWLLSGAVSSTNAGAATFAGARVLSGAAASSGVGTFNALSAHIDCSIIAIQGLTTLDHRSATVMASTATIEALSEFLGEAENAAAIYVASALRTYLIEAQDRVLSIEAQDRAYTPEAESRTATAEAEDRIATFDPEQRILTIEAENRSVTS